MAQSAHTQVTFRLWGSFLFGHSCFLCRQSETGLRHHGGKLEMIQEQVREGAAGRKSRARRSAMQSINANNLCSELNRPDCMWRVAAMAVAKSQVIEIYVLVSRRAARPIAEPQPNEAEASY
jgi:hypothetical protein